MTNLQPRRAWPARIVRSACRALALAAAFALVATLLVAFGAWLWVRPMAGEWNARVPLGHGLPPVTVGVSRTLRALTDPRVAPWLSGLQLETPAGPVRLRWQADTRTLTATCDPCRVPMSAAAGGRALALDGGAEFTLHRDGDDALSGHVASGAVVLPWRGTLARDGLLVQADLAPTPIASAVALFGAAVPEARRARIDGRVAARWQLALPSGRLTTQAFELDDFRVDGLGTEALRDVALPRGCGAGAKPARWLERAVVASEDARFHEHAGYDLDQALAWWRTNDAAGAVRGGGSTLTQQLAKQLYTGDERSAARKLRELLYAVEMERTLGKGRILQLYLALAPWGPHACGAEAAARRHLGKPAASLNAIEAAWLASLLPQPMRTPPPVDRVRIAEIVKGMSGMTTRQRRAWLRAVEDWTPPGAAGHGAAAAPG